MIKPKRKPKLNRKGRKFAKHLGKLMKGEKMKIRLINEWRKSLFQKKDDVHNDIIVKSFSLFSVGYSRVFYEHYYYIIIFNLRLGFSWES